MLFVVPPGPECLASVIVPVRDEAQRLPRALTCLANQVQLSGRAMDPRQYEVLVLANNCTDASAEICRAFARRHPNLALQVAEVTLPEAEATVGMARRLLMEEASARLHTLGAGTRVIASTDGDTRVGPGWLAATLRAVNGGADAVAGRILLDDDERGGLEVQTRRALLQSVGYAQALAAYEDCLDPLVWDPWPRHGQHFGASFAVTASTYRLAGGMPRTAENEDVGLYDALLRIDARVRHSPDVRVWTSGRLTGRVKTGLAGQLGIWSEMGHMGQVELVEAPATTYRWITLRRALRACWRNRFDELRPHAEHVTALARELSVAPTWLLTRLAQSTFFGSVWEDLRRHFAVRWDGYARVPIAEAILDLRRRCQSLRLAPGR